MSSVWRYPWAWRGCVGAWCPSRDRFRGSSQLTDHSTAHNNGTLTNMDPATDWVVSGDGIALDFDGSNDQIAVGNPSILNLGTGNMSVSAWVYRRTSATTNLRVLSKGAETNAAEEAGFAIWGSDSNISFAVNPSGTRVIIVGSHPGILKWFHVTGVMTRGENMELFVNGVSVASATSPSGSITGSRDMFISRSAGDMLWWIGQLDDIRIYNRALTASEVSQLYSLGRGGAYRRVQKRIGKAGTAPPFKAAWLAGSRQTKIIGGGVR